MQSNRPADDLHSLQRIFCNCQAKQVTIFGSLFNVLSGKLIKVKKSEGRTADLKACQLGEWLKESLLLIDLGYFSYNLFDRIERHGGYFLSRVKSNTKIVCNHRGKTRGDLIDVDPSTSASLSFPSPSSFSSKCFT